MSKYEESYLVLIVDVTAKQAFHILAPNRTALAEMLGLMSKDRYVVSSITTVVRCGNYDEYMGKLRAEDKPFDLFFGLSSGSVN